MCKQLVIVKADTPEEFQKAFNSKLRELQDCDPQYEFNHGAGYCAYIIYSDNGNFIGRNKASNVSICDSCLRCLNPGGNARVKSRKCVIYGSIRRTDSCDKYLEVVM